MNNLIPDNVTGLKILKWRCSRGSRYVKILKAAFLENEYYIERLVISLDASVMLFIYAELSSHVLAIRERESSSKHANCDLSRIENSCYHQEIDL